MGTISFRGSVYQWQWYTDQQLTSTVSAPIAYDTETRYTEDARLVPELALAMAYDGKQLLLIHPDKLADFWTRHARQHFVCHNVAFDFWVTQQCLPRRILWELADQNRLHDSMLLDMLVQLATDSFREGRFKSASLGVLASDLLGTDEVDKTNPYRELFGRLIGETEEQIEQTRQEWIAYALTDVLATYQCYPLLYQKGLDCMRRAGWKPNPSKLYSIRHDAVARWGILSECLQVRAAISFAQLSRRGIRVDVAHLDGLLDNLEAKVANRTRKLDKLCPGLFLKYREKKRAGQYKLTPKGSIRKSNTVLAARLEQEASSCGIRKPPTSGGKRGGISLGWKDWRDYARKSPFLATFVNLGKALIRRNLVSGLRGEPLAYIRYHVLKKTGRTSASRHKSLPGMNVQQMPREPEFRAILGAREGSVWCIVDYGYIELRTLAATALAQLGKSRLAEVVREHTAGVGLDPHQLTASYLLGVSPDEYLKLDKATQKKARQNAKAVNFGYPGGLGAKRFVDYAKGTYGLRLTQEEAKAFKEKWVATYPEMEAYLQDQTWKGLLYNLGIPRQQSKRWDGYERDLWEVVVGGTPKRLSAVTVWNWLLPFVRKAATMGLCCRQVLTQVEEKQGDLWLGSKLLGVPACTLTGRIRAGCKYTDSKNTPFQGLASDGAKEAVWRLLYKGYDVAAFVHDEIVVECAADKGKATLATVERVMIQEMEKVLGLPVAVEGKVARVWEKG